MNAFDYLTKWYMDNCDGDWEHQYGIRINTIDNPGWQIQIDLAMTSMEDVNLEYRLQETSESDWMGFSVKDKVFSAAGDLGKLELILNTFKELSEQRRPNLR